MFKLETQLNIDYIFHLEPSAYIHIEPPASPTDISYVTDPSAPIWVSMGDPQYLNVFATMATFG